jgi:hypothetical protein
MWRVVRVALVAVVTVVTFAHASSRCHAGQGKVDTALQQANALARKGLARTPEPGLALQLKLSNVLALAQPLLKGRIGERASLARRAAPQVATQSSLPAWLNLKGSRPSLAYSVTDKMSLGLRYSFQRNEDVDLAAAKAGALDDDYQNHKLMVSARWEF